MKKFIANVFVFLIVILCFCFLSDYLITKGLKKSESFYFVDWNNMYRGNINADLIINGNSKAYHHVSPKILDSLLSINTYNLGIDGYGFVMQKAKYDIYSKYNKAPKIILHIVGAQILDKRDNLYQKQKFAPYISDSIIKNVTKKYNGFSFFERHLPLVRYQSDFNVVPNSVASLIGFSHLFKDASKFKGYEAIDEHWRDDFENFKKKYPNGIDYEINKNSLKHFDNYLKDEIKKGSKIFLVYSPTYMESQKYINNRDEIIKTYKILSKKHGVSFLDYSSNELTTNKSFFYNSQHLNKKGAELFSHILATDLKESLNSSKLK